MILYNRKEILFGQFPNGEINLRKFDTYSTLSVHEVTLKYESDADLFKLLLVRKALEDAVKPVLRITYAPYSRMDRDSNTYVFSLKVFADFINAMDWNEVTIYEPHSDVVSALIDRVRVVDVTASPRMRSYINVALDTEYQACYPDVGAFKRYSEKFKTSDPLIGFKRRDFETGKILSLDIQGTRNSDNVAIVDDLCSKGGTFVMAAEKLRAMGFKKIVLAVAHSENTIFKGEIFSSGLIDKVITTDSILNSNGDSPGLQVVPLTSWY